MFYQSSLLGTSDNQKRHYLKSYNNLHDFVFFLLICFSIYSVGKKRKRLRKIIKMTGFQSITCIVGHVRDTRIPSPFSDRPHSFSKRHQPSQIHVLKMLEFRLHVFRICVRLNHVKMIQYSSTCESSCVRRKHVCFLTETHINKMPIKLPFLKLS